MLNVALARLPVDCTAVAWIDGDIVFPEGAWAARTMAALEHHLLAFP